MGNKQFVQRIIQGIRSHSRTQKGGLTHLQSGTTKSSVYEEALIRQSAEHWGSEVELKVRVTLI